MLLAIFLSSVIIIVCGQEKDRLCITPAFKNGQCIPLSECDEVLELVQKPTRTQQEKDFLRRSKCYEDDPITVCCPLKNCTSPDGHAGTCVISHLCPSFVKALKEDLTPEQIDYFLRSKCSNKPISLCCVPENTTSEPVVSKSESNHTLSESLNSICSKQQTAFPPDTKSKCCGYDDSGGNKIIGGNTTAIEEHPWMALIEYENTERYNLLCGGVLISGRYVLTAAHCIHSGIIKFLKPTFVRLGEYDTGNDGPDCTQVEGGGIDCTDGIVRINIKSLTPHPEFNVSNLDNDIGLVRLKCMAPFTYFIRPICLPTSDITLNPPTYFVMTAVGWGTTENKSPSKIKLHVDLPFVNLQECQAAYQVYKGPKITADLKDYQLCAGGEAGKDTCKGDSGGPLMYENGRTFELIGVVSFGPNPCAEENIPGVYTKVYAYRDWILNTITE